MQRLQILKVTHTYREGTLVADFLVTQAQKAEFIILATELLWLELKLLLMADVGGVCFE